MKVTFFYLALIAASLMLVAPSEAKIDLRATQKFTLEDGQETPPNCLMDCWMRWAFSM